MNMLKSRLRDFKLSGIHNNIEERLEYASKNKVSYEEFLNLILGDTYG